MQTSTAEGIELYCRVARRFRNREHYGLRSFSSVENWPARPRLGWQVPVSWWLSSATVRGCRRRGGEAIGHASRTGARAGGRAFRWSWRLR